MRYRSEHDLHVLLHSQLSLQVLLCRDICEHENNLSLSAKVMSFNPHIIVYTIKLLVYLLILLILCLTRGTVSIIRSIARTDHSLVHMQQHGVICGVLDHLNQEHILVDFCDPSIDSRQVINQLLERCQDGAIIYVETDHIVDICAFI